MLSDIVMKNWETDIIGHAQIILSDDLGDHIAWTVKFPDTYGVAIPYVNGSEVNETFANARIYSGEISLNSGTPQPALILCTEKDDIKEPFASLCAGLIDPGVSGEKRDAIISDPVKWWKEWKEMLGNRSIDERIYDVLGELCVFYKLVSSGEDANWNGPDGASYDIECEHFFAEVKSTSSRSKREVTISNQFQLDPPNKNLFLYLCQFEPTVQTGVSINSMLKKFSDLGYNKTLLNQKLNQIGFEEGMSSRNRSFVLHDMLKYTVDASFPRITASSFVGGALPQGITKITYTVDLSGLASVSMLRGDEDEIQNN